MLNEANAIIDVCLAKTEKLVKTQNLLVMYSVTTKPNSIRGNYNQASNAGHPV